MTIQSDLQQSMLDEGIASHDYRVKAISARSVGDEVSAKLWIHIAEEEDGHYNEFKDRLEATREEAEHTYRRIGGGMESVYVKMEPGDIKYHPQKTHRPFPQIYSDWIDLADAIKAKCQDDLEVWTSTNYQLQQIAEETENMDKAKRWLVNKAGELGIS